MATNALVTISPDGPGPVSGFTHHWLSRVRTNLAVYASSSFGFYAAADVGDAAAEVYLYLFARSFESGGDRPGAYAQVRRGGDEGRGAGTGGPIGRVDCALQSQRKYQGNGQRGVFELDEKGQCID